MSDTFTLLDYPQRMTLIYAEGYSRTKNMPFNITRKTMYKGVDNTLGFDIKNQDRKPVNLLGKSVIVHIMQVRTGELLVQRRADLVQAENGFCEVTVYSSDLIDLAPGIYQLSAVVYDETNRAKSLFSDLNRRATVELEIVDGAYPTYLPSTELTFTEDSGTWVSQPCEGNLQKNDSSTLHTLQICCTGFKGRFYASTSIEYGSMGYYSPVKFIDSSNVITFDGTNDIQGWNFHGSFRWLTVTYIPDEDNTGTVDKVLYRS